MRLKDRLIPLLSRIGLFLSVLGPGIITAAADNDAPGIATYSMAGSTFGYGFLWILIWVTLGEGAVMEMGARMGAATGQGLTDLIRERFGLRLTVLVLAGLFLANLGTTAAEFAGIGSSAELFGVSRYLAVPLGALTVGLLVLRGSYRRVEKVLLLLSLYSLAYVASAFAVRPPRGEVARQALVPTIQANPNYLLAVLATVGTTITPWGTVYIQASIADKGVSMKEYGLARLDALIGTISGNVVSGFIIICTAATLFAQGIAVDSAEQAAMALAPVAGRWAQSLFGIGLLGASLLAASVLPLATTYSICEAFGWERGINTTFKEAPAFYIIYGSLIVLSALIVLIPGLNLFPLMWLSQVANAVLLPLILVLMLKLANDAGVVGQWRNSRFSNVLTGVMIALVSVATVGLLLAARAT